MKVLVHWVKLAVCSGIILLGACSWGDKVPQIAQGLSPNFEQAEQEFQQRIGRAFPLGTDHSLVLESLSAQGFSVLEQGTEHIAAFEKSGFPCKRIWRIIWTVDEQQQLSMIKASYGGVCL